MTDFHIAGLGVAIVFVIAVVVIALVLAVVVALIYAWLRGTDKTHAKSFGATFVSSYPFIFVLALVGGFTGQLGGGSRESIVGQLLPALLTVFGGFIAYYLGAKKDPGGKISVNTLAFVLGFFITYNVSAVWRQSHENWDFCREVFSDSAFASVEQRQDREAYWRSYCDGVFEMWMEPT